MKRAFFAALALSVFVFAAGAPASAIQRPSVVTPDTPYIEAIRKGDLDTIKAELTRGTRIDTRDKLGRPALIVAIMFGERDIAHYLLEQGARPDLKDKSGNSALCYIAQSGNAVLGEALLKAGADPDRTCEERETPIIIAARAGHEELVDLLIEYKADLEASDLTGRTALSLARDRRGRAMKSSSIFS